MGYPKNSTVPEARRLGEDFKRGEDDPDDFERRFGLRSKALDTPSLNITGGGEGGVGLAFSTKEEEPQNLENCPHALEPPGRGLMIADSVSPGRTRCGSSFSSALLCVPSEWGTVPRPCDNKFSYPLEVDEALSEVRRCKGV